MKKLVVLALFLAGCAGGGTTYKIECKNAPQPFNYKGWKTCPNACPDDGTIVVVKTRWGLKTFKVRDCSDEFRVIRWKRVKGQ